jgi:hypothetical protein
MHDGGLKCLKLYVLIAGKPSGGQSQQLECEIIVLVLAPKRKSAPSFHKLQQAGKPQKNPKKNYENIKAQRLLDGKVVSLYVRFVGKR